MEELCIVRIALLGLMILFGLPGNLAALTITIRSIRKKRQNSLAYVHLALGDFLSCSVFAAVAITLESLEYYTHYNMKEDFGSWEPLLKFLYEQVDVRLFMSCTFLSTLTLTFIAAFRTWRLFNPFGQPKNVVLVGYFVLSDAAVVLLAVYFRIPNLRAATTSFENSTSCHECNFTESLFNEGIPVTDRNETLSQESGILIANDSSSREHDAYEPPRSLLSGMSMFILTMSIGASVILTILFYTIICFKLRYEFSKSNFGGNSQRKAFLRRQVKHLITHVVLIAIMIVTLIPALLFTVIAGEAGSASIRLIMPIAGMSSVVNPYVYCLLLPGNRLEVRKMLGCLRGSNMSENETSLPEIPSNSMNDSPL